MRFLRTRRSRSVAAGVVAVMGVNATMIAPTVAARWDAIQAQTHAYKAKYGHWDVINLPAGMKISAVHAALLPDDKILITAGSGNDATTFAAGAFATMLYDPQTRAATMIPTPTDMFCGGQTFLPDGRLLIAGGTQNYEVLKPNAKKAGGVVTIVSTDTTGSGRLIGANTVLLGSNGQKYVTDTNIVLPPARITTGPHGAKRLAASRATVWAFAADEGTAATSKTKVSFTIPDLDPASATLLTLSTNRLTIDKHNFEGSAFSYIFDPVTERYLRVSNLTVKRWYPTLTDLSSGKVLAVSGLDGNGQLVGANQGAEQFDPADDSWTARPDLTQRFPTYPALFQTAKPDTLFYSGSNTGYGDDVINRRATGLWNVRTNAFTPVSGLRDPKLRDSSGSAWLGPVQDQRVAIFGGGLSGETFQSTNKIDTIDLNSPNPTWQPGPNLPHAARYPLLVNLPDDSLLVTGGSGAYRGENNSTNHDAAILNPDTMKLTRVARPSVARSYHSEALLLPDGRVLTMGSNPLYSDAANTKKAPFEQRLELYTPAYLYQGARPTIGAVQATAGLGQQIGLTTPEADDIAKVRFIRPSAATHSSNLTQRDVAIPFTTAGDRLQLSLPASSAIMPAGYYMVFLIDKAGVPSMAKWILIKPTA
jgi:hypothetical protein